MPSFDRETSQNTEERNQNKFERSSNNFYKLALKGDRLGQKAMNSFKITNQK